MATNAFSQPSPNYDSGSEKVTNRFRVIDILNRLKDARSLVSVTIADSAEPYNSAILQVATDPDYLVLDELTPQQGHDRLLEKRTLRAFARLDGVEIRFAAELAEAGSDNGIAFYRLPLPRELDYAQKRSAFRAQVGMGLDVPIQLSDDRGNRVEGRLSDLSVGGLGGVLPPDVRVDKGTVLTCLMELPGVGRFTCPMEVRFAKVKPDPERLRIGGRFVDLTMGQERALQRSVNFLQRELLRKQTRD